MHHAIYGLKARKIVRNGLKKRKRIRQHKLVDRKLYNNPKDFNYSRRRNKAEENLTHTHTHMYTHRHLLARKDIKGIIGFGLFHDNGHQETSNRGNDSNDYSGTDVDEPTGRLKFQAGR